MVVLSTERSGSVMALCGRSLNSPRTVQIASLSSWASSTYWPSETSTTLFAPVGVAFPATTCSTAFCRSSRCLSLSGLDRSCTRWGLALGSSAGGAAVAVAGTAANRAAPRATDRAFFKDVLLGSDEDRPATGGEPPTALSDDRRGR